MMISTQYPLWTYGATESDLDEYESVDEPGQFYWLHKWQDLHETHERKVHDLTDQVMSLTHELYLAKAKIAEYEAREKQESEEPNASQVFAL